MFARGEEVKVVVMNGAVLGEVFRGRYVETKEGFIGNPAIFPPVAVRIINTEYL